PGTLGSFSLVTCLTSSAAWQQVPTTKVPAARRAAAARVRRALLKNNSSSRLWFYLVPLLWAARPSFADAQDDLAAGPWPYAFQHLMRHTRIGKRPDGSDVHGQIARVDHCCNPCQMRGGDINEKERPKTRSWWKRASCRQRWCRI